MLEHIFNKCIYLGTWPTSFKTADIIPIYKDGAKNITSNYRPIALISNIAKIFEKIVLIRLQKFLLENKTVRDNQFGFMKNKGTEDALAFATNLIYSSLDRNKAVIATFLDLSKAFDTVDHTILLQKLYKYGIKGLAHDLFKSYLSNRKKCVKINETHGDYKDLNNIAVP